MCIELNFVILADFFSLLSNVAYHFVDHWMWCDDTIIRIEPKEKEEEVEKSSKRNNGGMSCECEWVHNCIQNPNRPFREWFLFVFAVQIAISVSLFILFSFDRHHLNFSHVLWIIIKIRVIHSRRRIQHTTLHSAFIFNIQLNQTKQNDFYSSFMFLFFFLLKKNIFIFLDKTKSEFCLFEFIPNVIIKLNW